jgi:radical SAM superfamily enzyme YgiQ (UPF0313 family)
MRVLLIYPHSREELIGYGDLGAIAEPLALEYLAGGIRLDGHQARILDLRLHRDELDNTVLDFQPDVIGVTGYSMHVLRVLEICRRVRKLRPSCVTVVGGHHATIMPEDFFVPEVSFVVSGEGVAPLRRLLRGLEESSGLKDIPGLWSRSADASDRFVSGGPQPRLEIDDLPLPDRTLVRQDREAYFIDWMKPIALLRTSVGCPYRCSFCSLWKIMEGHYHMREHDRVIEELRQIPEECVFLVDDEAFVNGKRMQSLALAIREANIQKRYFAYCRIDTLLRQPELMRLWRSIGLERLFIGLEAITEVGLKDYNKRLQVAQIEAGLDLARELGIHVFAGFVVNTNYTPQDFKRLIRFIEHHKIDYPSFTILTPIPGTQALDNFDEVMERQPNGRPNWDLFDLQHPVTKTQLPHEEFMQEYKRLYVTFGKYYQPHHPYLPNPDVADAAVPNRGTSVQRTAEPVPVRAAASRNENAAAS